MVQSTRLSRLSLRYEMLFRRFRYTVQHEIRTVVRRGVPIYVLEKTLPSSMEDGSLTD